jgi:GH15 family glucan-1,4-alpha-glucosidase
MIIRALMHLGYEKEAKAHFYWLAEILERDGAEGLQPVYTLDGGRILPERDLPYLNVNDGSRQFQLDIYGHVLLAASEYFHIFGELSPGLWQKLADIADYVSQAWRRPDFGPWATATKAEHFVASKAFCWAALDQAHWLAGALQKTPNPRWLSEKSILHRTICEQGFDLEQNSFVRAFGDLEIDSSSLWLPVLNFLPTDDPRIQGTINAIQLELSQGVFVMRTRSSRDFHRSDAIDMWSTFLFISCLALTGREDEASDRLAEVCTYASPMGLLGDQFDPSQETIPHDFPSSSAHFALVNAALSIGQAKGRLLAFPPRVAGKAKATPLPKSA